MPSENENKVLVRNTANHPAMHIPPGGTGEVAEDVLALCAYFVRVEAPGNAEPGSPEAEPESESDKPKGGRRGR